MGRAWIWLCLIAAPAAADPITSRDYAIELYEGVAIGDSSQTGMGGAGSARLVGSAGALSNASAPAVRKATDNDRWSWDYHLDFLTGRYSSDYDNNGTAVEEGGASLATLGGSLRVGTWAFAITLTAQTAPIDGTMDPKLRASVLRTKLVIAKWFAATDIALGIGTVPVRFAISTDVENEAGEDLFAITGAGLAVGATWVPRGQSFRLAAAAESRILSSEVATQTCDPMNCQGHMLPEEIVSPGRTILGMAYRWGPTPWNQQVPARFRDEASVTLAADLVITGSSTNGNGIEAFGRNELQPSGRDYAFSPRAGAEVEALPGRLRIRGGSYWEPGRFEGVGGRIHGTFGFDLRALEFRLWGIRRGRLGAT
ncbi:MAG: hypothetical protein ABI867_40590, partial [Kofleriaceae bacterium]